ncbi:MAG: hypothetical protein ACRDRX_04415 [Pseudonocardiaceae bacterium]
MIVFTIDGDEYRFDDDKLSVEEAIAVEDATGMGVRMFHIGITMSSAKALKCLVWLAKKRAGQAVRLDDVTFDCMDLLRDLRREEPAGDASDPTAGQETTPGSDNGTTPGDVETGTSESSPTT